MAVQAPRLRVELSARDPDFADGVRGEPTGLNLLFVLQRSLYSSKPLGENESAALDAARLAPVDEVEAWRLLRREVRHAYIAVSYNRQRLAEAARLARKADRQLSAFRNQVPSGASGLVDLLNALDQAHFTKRQVIDAYYTVEFSRLALLAMMGALAKRSKRRVRVSYRPTSPSARPHAADQERSARPPMSPVTPDAQIQQPEQVGRAD